MTSDERLLAHQRIRDLAVARAHELRAESIQSAWRAVAAAVSRRVGWWRQRSGDARRTMEVV
jgi:hypothetical protein